MNVGWWAGDEPLWLANGRRFGSTWGWARPILLPTAHRTRHAVVIGGSGSGKTRVTTHSVRSDILHNRSFTLVDPAGDMHHDNLAFIADRALPDGPTGRDPEELGDKLVLIEPSNQRYGAVGLNPLETPPGVHPFTVVDGLIETFKEMWRESWGARMEDLLRNLFLLLQELGLTLLEILPVLGDDALRARLVARSRNPAVRSYFEGHLGGIRPAELKAWFESTRNKISALVSRPYIRPVVGQARSTISFKDILDGKWLLVNLSRDHLRESRRLLGAVLISLEHSAAVGRERVPPAARTLHTLYVDELPEFWSPAILYILTGARKYGLACWLCLQNLTQPPFDQNPSVMDTILGNTHTRICFAVSKKDADRLASEFFLPKASSVKFQRSFLGIPLEEPRLWSLSEEKEHAAQLLMTQRQAECVISFKGVGDDVPYLATVPHVPDAPENEAKIDLLRRHVARRYCRPLVQIEREIERRQAALRAGTWPLPEFRR